MEKFLLDVLVGLAVAALSLLAKWQAPYIRSLFDAESRRQADQINGRWKVTEVFSGSKDTDTFNMKLSCHGSRVTGDHVGDSGPDDGRQFDIEGSYKDQILSFTWMPDNRSALESGTVTARLVRDKRLEGHGLYIEPTDGKVYTSTFVADKQ
ncbi:MAG: hypothetical protein ACREPP_05225 [Rhodanobacteraceae bacterium]